MKKPIASLVLFSGLAAVSAQAVTLTFSDDFNSSIAAYSVASTFANANTSGLVTALTSPSANLNLNTQFNDINGNPAGASVRVAVVNSGWTIDPAAVSGINSLNISVENSTTGGVLALAVIQGGQAFYSQPNLSMSVAGTVSDANILPAEFLKLDGTSGAPDLSVSGGIITLGFIVGRGTTSDGAKNFNYTFDNLSITADVTAVPEPSAFAALAGLGALGLATLRRRRRA